MWGTLGNDRKPLETFLRTSGHNGKPMGTNGSLWKPLETHGGPWGCLETTLGDLGNKWKPLKAPANSLRLSETWENPRDWHAARGT
eukprot:6433986-Pyramimonas_sp.AAC.1